MDNDNIVIYENEKRDEKGNLVFIERLEIHKSEFIDTISHLTISKCREDEW